MKPAIVESSPQALELAKSHKEATGNLVYPFDSLNVGQSFTVKLSEAKVGSLQSLCSRKSKGGKQFKILKHEAQDILEVARIA